MIHWNPLNVLERLGVTVKESDVSLLVLEMEYSNNPTNPLYNT